MELVEGIYKNNPIADYFNEILAETAAAYIRERLKKDPSAGMRILEIGAGTGGTSTMVFKKFQPYRDQIQEYCYTDISKAFLMHAEKEYGPGNPCLTYRIFNVEAPIAGQSIDAGGYDIVIAANVLHATKNIRQTLRNTKAALKKNGVLLLNEMSANALFTHLTFGLLEGWWLYEDQELRIPGCPGLSPGTWQEVLVSEGFQSVVFPAQKAHDLGQQIIAAESDGKVRQKQHLKTVKQTPLLVAPGKKINSKAVNHEVEPHPETTKIATESSSLNHSPYSPHSPIPDVTNRMAEDYVKETIIEKLSASLKVDIDVIDADESFADFGLDSILGVEFIQAINQTLGIELKTISVFEYNSVNQLTTFIISQYKDVISAGLGQEGTRGLAPLSKDVKHDLSPGSKEAPPVYSYSNRFIQTRVPGPGIKEKEESIGTGDSIQKGPIAIIGMSGRFAKSKTVKDLWEHLANGTDLVEEVSRWDFSECYPDSSDEEKNYCHHGSFLDDIDRFDPLFFNISGVEATYMDPQQRFFLEECWKALEDAGYAGTAVQGRLCGVYVGFNGGDYQRLIGDNPPAQALWGNIYSVLPARISYYLNLQGPAVTIDTACSSSLTAIHLACQGLWAGETELALAGGVFIQCTPAFFISGNRGRMLSATGHCYTFDERADGFVPGEGVGVVVLKQLKEAIADGDHIYGVIRGSGINQDGTTNGITAPSANSQERLERYVYDTFNIHPEQISMVEAHGTGTILGDPIEYDALTRAFGKYTDKKEYCAIGSIKTNIGHATAAAGIAGFIKILLSLQHKQIPPSLHYRKGNPNIQFEGSPFYVNTTLKDWESEPNSTRCAVISAFGLSGTNAHLAIGEAPKLERQHPEKPGYLIVLSARTLKQLHQQVEQIIEYCKQESRVDCGNMSYTLLLGRKHLTHRLACVVRTREELVNLFKKWLEKGKVLQIYVSEVHEKDHREQPSLKRYGNQCIRDCQNVNKTSEYLEHLAAIADLYIQGYELEFEQLFSNGQYSRISLPTYPFARERYWIAKNRGQGTGDRGQQISSNVQVIHPLLHQNTSDFSKQRFSSTFTGREFFLADHVVKGKRILPGVAYLEMARAAVGQAAGVLEEDQVGVRLKNVVWVQPIVVGDQPVQVQIGLFPKDNGQITYEIYSRPKVMDEGSVLHSQGSVLLGSAAEAPTLDLKALQTECSQTSLGPGQCYEAFRAMGIDYGPGHQGIEEVYVGHSQVLAKLSLPSSVSNTRDQFILHPSLMDSALQASIGLIMGAGDMMSSTSPASLKPALPFALEELEIFGNCTSTMWVLVRYSDDSAAGDRVQEFDIDLCDETGMICVRMKGLSSRVLEGNIQSNNVPKTVPSETSIEPLVGTGGTGGISGAVMLTPVWDTVPIEKGQTFPSPGDRVVIVGGTKNNISAVQQHYPKAHALEIQPGDTIDTIAKKLEAHGFIDHILWIAPHNIMESLAGDALIEEQNQGVLQCFRMIKALLGLGYGTRGLGWSVLAIQTQPIRENDGVNPTHASLYGLIGSMAKEYSNWKIRLIDLEANCDWPLADIFTLPTDPRGNARVYRGQQWHRQQLIPFHCPPPPADRKLYKTGGVYVVIGGAGGIGEAWSEYMIRAYQARIIWIGRRERDAVIQAKLDRLAALGPAPLYIAADATDLDALHRAYEEIKQQYEQVHGVIHSAIVLSDQSLANMDEERFKAGLSAKVDVSVHMARVFEKEPLDFVLFFSSMMAFTKLPGQSNYASGCTFKDAFAHQLSQEWPCKVRVMNWGYWGSVGVVSSKDYQDRMTQAGIGSIEPPEAMEALETLLAGTMPQIALIKTTKPLTMEEMNPGELIAVYPENFPSIIQDMRNHIHKPKQGSRIKRMKSKKDLQMKEMNRLLCRLLWGQLQSIGLFTEKNPVIADLKKKTGLRDLYDRWLEESIAVLARNNYLKYDGKSCHVKDTTPIDIDAVWKQWDQQKKSWLENPDRKAQIVLLEATMKALPEILTGKQLATDIIFPNSSLELVEGIYKNNLVADYFNEVLADTVAAYIQERLQQDSSTPMRILEIGAGTGGTSAMVFSKIQPYRDQIQEYCYTDISKAFLMHAEKEYGSRYPYLTYKIFNVEIPIAEQDIDADGYDIVIAANVLHATKNIRQTLRNTKAVLKKNGLILLNELSGNSLFTHLTFGLLEGWWLYQDPELRIPGSPGLSPQTWQRVLESEGFRSVFFPAQEAHELGQQVAAAESNGVVRQPYGMSGTSRKINQKFSRGVLNRSVSGSVGQLDDRQAQIGNPLIMVPRPHPETNENQHTRVAQHIGSPRRGAPGRRRQENTELLKEKSTAYIKKLVAETLQIPHHKIDSSEPLEKYGIDSILVVQLTNAMSKVFDNISSTLFFKYQTIDALVGHFLETQEDELIALVGLEDQELDKEIPGDEKILVESPSVRPGLTFGKSGHFHQFRDPEIEGLGAQPSRVQDVAIIGLSGRYPQANHVNEFWNNLKEGRNCITEIPKDRWDWKEYFDEKKGKRGSIYTKWGGFIRDIDKFDPLFFGISPAEAESMDPQERLFLEVVYASIEDAGYTPANLCDSRKIGVFAGVMNGNYPLGASYWSIANRISYLLNFQGPSIAVDTACSSSLTAIHLALESLYSGMSECAIAGGVNLIVDPFHYLKLTAMTMLSNSDKNKAFGDQADGFVDGEGVGAIVLKPLPKAIAHGDHIYGIIKGSMLNAGGKTNGYTVPNPNAQFRLISEAFQRARVHARTISYLEAHGTGTALGDPIEIEGLTRAFEQETKDKQFCAVGSVKSNIGHCESAAGIAGVTKVLLQLRNQQLAPSLHSEVLNPNINFSDTPFLVQQELAKWERPKVKINGETREYPRRAGISSFGAGGANAHLVIEEYIPRGSQWVSGSVGQSVSESVADGGQASRVPHLIILSAKDEERLREQAQRLLASIREQQYPDASLADIAYTLQVGREAMEERLAVIVRSIKELEEKLKGFLEAQEGVEDLYRGQVKRNKETLAVFAADEDLQKAIDAWITKGKYAKLLDLWVKGLIFDWDKLYGDSKPHKPRRISLPTYPFARERYWAPEVRGQRTEDRGQKIGSSVQVIHPLLHQNTSDLSEQRFSSTFTGQEFFLADHVVKGQRVLPGVAYLEMARAALAQAARALEEGQTGIRLKNVVWAQPIAVGEQPVQAHIGLFPGDNGEIAYEIYSESKKVDAEPVVHIHCQGTAVLGSNSAAEAPTLDLKALQAECSQNSLSSTQCYEAFRSIGIDYGPGHQGIKKVVVGSGGGHVLAKLSLPASVTDTADQFILHPSLMDSALQASIALMMGPGDTAMLAGGKAPLKPTLPFALQELEIHGKCTTSMWALIRTSDGSKPGDRVQKLDVDLCDEQGIICVRMKRFSMRMPQGEKELGQGKETSKTPAAPEINKTVPVIGEELLREKAANYFKKLLSSVIKLPAHRIEADAPMEKYGIDSVMVMQLTNQLEKTFGSLSKTLFFEYQNIRELTGYFLESHRDQLVELLGIGEKPGDGGQGIEDRKWPGPVKSAVISRGRSRHRFGSLRIESGQEKTTGALDIAIIGLSGRYPGARNIREFWKNLREGKDCITEIPEERWDHSLYFDEDKNKPGKTYSKWGGFLEGVDEFDPLFFNISPLEAEVMDPQERLFLECVFETLEDAGYTRDAFGLHRDFGLVGNVGVYAGVMYEEYQLYGAQEQVLGRPFALPGNPSSIANRVSYFCNFHGPSMAVDTMCSSSLTAIHLACQSLQRGECEVAIAGGVNVSIHPNKYLMLGQGKFASSTGRCESFGQGGDGYVPGEGVGAVLLKPLSKAIIDRDHIYGIIKATAINHGGKTHGYTVPNANAQASVIGRAFKQAGISPVTISYIEAHGTGTSLGDPIEIASLTKTFREYTQDKQFCAIGSAKSNIGHCESAAGIAGVTRVLLQMQHGQLVPSLHSKVLNPNIDFSNTPFVVQQELAEWKRPVLEINGGTREYPRRAGVSSFGAGGANAHLVIEEYIPRDPESPPIAVTTRDPAIIVLSAKNEERLREQVQQLLAAAANTSSEQQFSNHILADMAYTLQVGREAMEERLGVIVGSIKELREKLEGFLENREGIENLYRGRVKRNKETLAVFTADEDLQQAIDGWISKRKYAKLLDFWVKGLILDWNKFYEGGKPGKPRRISLPTYPFARERYWRTGSSTTTVSASHLHPLVQQNTSHLSEIRFSSTFTGQEFFLADHVVKGQRVLPGVAYLEMARAAVAKAAGALEVGQIGIRLKDLVWAQPITVGEQSVQVHIGLFPGDNGEIAYEIYSESQKVDAEPVVRVHCQGTAVLSSNSAVEAPTLDIKALQAECSQGSLSSTQCYEAFRSLGIDYGPGHQGIMQVVVGEEQVLAKLSLPSSVSDTQDQFVLHPSLMDSALQASIGLIMSSGGTMPSDILAPLKPALPFALQELEIFGHCTSSMWALIRYSDGSTAGDRVQKLDIDLCDHQETICVRMKGFSSRVLEGDVGQPSIKSFSGVQGAVFQKSPLVAEGKEGTLLLHPGWKEQAAAHEAEAAVPDYAQHLVILCEPKERWKMGNEEDGFIIIELQSKQKNIEKRFQTYAARVFGEIQRIIKEKPEGKVLIQVVVSTQDEGQLFSGLSGLLKTAQLENPKLIGQLIEVEPGEDSQGIIEKLEDNSRSPLDDQVRYQDGKRWVAGWSDNIGPISPIGPMALPWKDRGIYLITGGAGGVGLIFAREIARQVKETTLILAGRSPLNEDKQTRLKELQALGARIEYKQVDVTQKKSVASLIQEIQEDFGSLHGIIHSAGVIRDNFILRKTKDEFQEVLAPKVSGLVNLDQASKGLSLDFFVLFSSVAGAVGNPGQADYAAANAFMDAYARYRNNLVTSKQRQGQTLSINWPLWKEGGMHVDEEIEKMIRQNMGMAPMQTPTGIRALYQSLASGKAQVMIMEGNIAQLRNAVGLGSIEFNQSDNSAIDDEIAPGDDAFYQDLLRKISKGELSEDQFKNLIINS
jgi:acyl transferase domain-containing protein/ubiquinone/menaquinone biosynthesis C-methylase UbiE